MGWATKGLHLGPFGWAGEGEALRPTSSPCESSGEGEGGAPLS